METTLKDSSTPIMVVKTYKSDGTTSWQRYGATGPSGGTWTVTRTSAFSGPAEDMHTL